MSSFLYKGLKVLIQKGLFQKIRKFPFYNDEPKCFSFSVQWTDHNDLSGYNSAGGCSFSRKTALIRALGETFERYTLSTYQDNTSLWSNYNNLKKLHKRVLNPKDILSFSYFKTKPNFEIYKNEFDMLEWTEGVSLTQQGKSVLIPAQLISVPYKFKPKEPVIRFPITTGAACYSSLRGAILNGLLEVIERDAFMISYLNKLSRNIINVTRSHDRDIKTILSSIKKYNLELYILDISTDVPVYSILAIIIDRTGLGPAVSLGMKSALGIKKAIIGAVEESIHGRFWIREALLQTKKTKIRRIQKKRYYLADIKERGILWSDPKMINKINFFFSGKHIQLTSLLSKKANSLEDVLKWFKKHNIEVIYKDITLPEIRKQGIYVVKVIIPQFQPLYLDEAFPYQTGERLKNVPLKLGLNPLQKIYKFPHPFL